MKYLRNSILSFTILLTGNPAIAMEVADVTLAEKLTHANQELILNGAGVRSKFFLDLYVGSLYLSQSATNLQQVIDDQSAMIRLNITSGMITAEKMRSATLDGFDVATDGNIAPIEDQIARFIALFDTDIIEGDQFSFASNIDSTITVHKNGIQREVIEGQAFRRALFSIWLGEEPAQKSLKEAMLGQ